MPVTEFQEKVYTHLLAIPAGQVTTYGQLAKVLSSSPRAVGGALRNNPFAPEVPCHRVIASDGYVGGFKGDWEKAPSGINQGIKLQLLKEEGVEFTTDGKLIAKDGVWFEGPWNIKKAKADLKSISEEKSQPKVRVQKDS
ncbi:uncharacterized protein Z518_06370 [Rhinocladiella mackenziei CBS 650.93]|uniref:Methylated-DNA--protein-cysteine methyltransferase n=1 Tax=Rhinocladiella mackenziei CBS 650.93 TaxID=1442369 RepID=A0A0D2H529_9EURO|nr:uncharacterized protein Z518_06370 [Rhinocladiella mackenziei CBS 650.93]KIX05498.1 hypothetical protein Z518_06370 [Rhinocladiella mackenziei CBS 650.93]